VVTVSGVSNRSVFVHLRVTATERKRWQEAAASSGRSLSQMIRDGIEGKLAGRDHREGDGGVASSVSPQTQSARAKAPPATLEERLAATVELLDGLGSGR
jgi:hypothetical protein